MSVAASFVAPTAVVTDNLDTDLEATVTYFKADGTTALTDLQSAITWIKNPKLPTLQIGNLKEHQRAVFLKLQQQINSFF